MNSSHSFCSKKKSTNQDMFEALNLQAQKVICRSVRPHLDQHKATGSSRVLKRLPPNKYLHIENFRKIQTTVHAFCNIGIGPPPLFEDIPQTMDTNPRAVYLYPNRSMNAGFNTK